MVDPGGAERLLRHEVAAALHDQASGVTVAASVAGDPPCTRLAWIDWKAAAIVARLACPPGRPSRMRPVVATDVAVVQAGIDDRVLAARVAPAIDAVRLVTATPEQPPAAPVSAEIALVRVGRGVEVLAIDALSRGGEPLGRLDAAGIGSLRLAGGRLTGRLGASHGMAAGFGPGRWTDDADEAAFEAGRPIVLPGWVPNGLERGPFHLEPDPVYPAAPPAIAVAWGAEPRRVLLRQAAGPLANPDTRPARAEEVRIGDTKGLLVGRRRFATLVWERGDRVFGVQVIGVEAPADVALRVAGSM